MYRQFSHLLPLLCVIYFVSYVVTWSSSRAVLASALFIAALQLLKVDQLSSARVADMLKRISVIGHRGCPDEAPENTLSAIRLAKARGAHAVEFDISLTKDGVAILLHDSTLDRTTNLSGSVGDFTWAEIKTASIKHNSKSKYKEEHVPSLQEAVELCLALELKMFLDLKGSSSLATAHVLRNLQLEYKHLHEHAVICSFYPQTIYLVRWYNPEFVTGLTHRHGILALTTADGPLRNKELWKQWLAPTADALLKFALYEAFWYVCGTSVFLVHERELCLKQVSYWCDRKVHLVAWTVNNDVQKAYFKDVLRVPFITDRC